MRRSGLALLLALGVACGGHGDERTKEAAMQWVERIAEPRQGSAGPPPLLVLLHGIGADEDDLFPIAGALDPRLKIVSLRAPRSYSIGYAWFNIDFGPGGAVRPNVAEARATLAELVAWVATAPARLGTDPRRTFLLGFSQGAMMSLGVLATAPERLAGVIALSGALPDTLFAASAAPEAMAQVPLLVAHGTHDDVLPVSRGRAIRDALTGRSRDFTYREFPVGHGIDDDEVDLVGRWLTERLG